MRQIVATFVLLLTMSGAALAQGFAREEGVSAQEIFFRYYPGQGYVQIKEYNLSLTGDDNPFENLTALVDDATYCDTHFNFAFIESVEERIFKDRGAVTAECNMFVRGDDIAVIMQDLLSGILERPVGAGVKGAELTVSFTGEDIQIADNNSEGMYGKAKRRSIFWKHDLEYFEAILTMVDWDKESEGLAKFLTTDLKSPELSADQISVRRAAIRKPKP